MTAATFAEPSAPAIAGAGGCDARGAAPAARIEWLDAVRGGGIVLVVAGHALGGLIDSPLGAGQGAMRTAFFAIYTFHMPLFLMLAGLLVTGRIGRGARAFVRGLLPTLVWPYFLWSALQFSLIFALGALVNRPAGAFWPTILALPWRTVSQFWFLYALFWMHLVAALVVSRGGTRALLALGLVLKVTAALVPLDVTVKLVAGNLVWYALGASIGLGGAERIVRAVPAYWLIIVLPLLTLGLAALALMAVGPGFGQARLAAASSPEIANFAWRLPAVPAALAGCLGVVALLSRAEGTAAEMLQYMGQRTMAIFVLHVIFVAGPRIVLTRSGLIADPVLLLPVLIGAGLAGPLLIERMLRPLGLQRLLGF